MNAVELRKEFAKYEKEVLDFRSFARGVYIGEQINKNKSKFEITKFIDVDKTRFMSEVFQVVDGKTIYTNGRFIVIHNNNDNDNLPEGIYNKQYNKVDNYDYPPYEKVLPNTLEASSLSDTFKDFFSKAKEIRMNKGNKDNYIQFIVGKKHYFFTVRMISKINKFLMCYPNAELFQADAQKKDNYFCLKDQKTQDIFCFLAHVVLPDNSVQFNDALIRYDNATVLTLIGEVDE